MVIANGWREVYWVYQARAGPASLGKQKTTHGVLKAQAGEQVCRESQMPLQEWNLLGNLLQGDHKVWTAVQDTGKRVIIGRKGKLFWSKSLGLSRYIWRWQESPGFCKINERGDGRRSERNQDKPSIFAVCLPRCSSGNPWCAIRLSFQRLQHVDCRMLMMTLEMWLCFIYNQCWMTGWLHGPMHVQVLSKCNMVNKNETLLCIFALTNSYFLNSLMIQWNSF